jgi:hypothetical protein
MSTKALRSLPSCRRHSCPRPSRRAPHLKRLDKMFLGIFSPVYDLCSLQNKYGVENEMEVGYAILSSVHN